MSGLRFASLGSGSRGNATLVQSQSTCLLVDCGYPAREMAVRCNALGVDPQCLDAILVTHEHGDHIRGVGAVARRFELPVWMTPGTWHASDYGRLDRLHLFGSHVEPWSIGDIEVTAVAVPHDAREPVQFIFRHAGQTLGLLTDVGSLSAHLLRSYATLDALLLECNHDPGMLANGPYPPRLQARVGGDYGHLANAQSAQLLGAIDHPRLRHLVAAHLSEKNNRPELARAALLDVAPGLGDRLAVLVQDRPSPWFTL